MDERPIANAKYYQKVVNIPRFSFQKVFNKNLAAVHKTIEVLVLDKSTYVDRCILDLSNHYDVHYNYIKDR